MTRPTREANASFLELAAKIFKPFTQELWGTIAAIVLIMSLVSLWLRRDEVSQTVQEFRPDPEEAGRCKRCFSLIATVGLEWMHQAGQSLMHFTVGLPGVQAKTAAETTLWLGWSIFLLLVLTAYTANLAAFPHRGAQAVELHHQPRVRGREQHEDMPVRFADWRAADSLSGDQD